MSSSVASGRRAGAGPAGGPSSSSPPPPSTRPRSATPEDDRDDDASAVSRARAAAEVSTMRPTAPNLPPPTSGRGGGGGGRRQRDEAAEAAVMGTATTEAGTSGVGNFVDSALDEAGERVKYRFLDFLQNYSEPIDGAADDENAMVQDGDNDDMQMDTLTPSAEDGAAQQPDSTARGKHYFPYLEQAAQMARRQLRSSSSPDDDDDSDEEDEEDDLASGLGFTTTLLVDHSHLLSYDFELAEAVEHEAVRFEPHLRDAVRNFMLETHPELDDPTASSGGGGGGAGGGGTGAGGRHRYHVAFHNLPTILPVRRLRTDQIGRLTSVSGTVTRTSDVRPELLVGVFRCQKCGLESDPIRQQYHFTRPILCRNPRCQNRSVNEFHLELSTSSAGGGEDGGGAGAGVGGSEFVDWQKLRVQENADEIPPGSMPRSIDVILRNDMVERAKAGDRVVFTGSLVVIPDGSALARAGEAARASAGPPPPGQRGGGGGPNEAAQGGGGGVRGLKALGVKELTYRTCFVASAVIPSDAAERVRAAGSEHRGAAATASFLFGGGGTAGGGGGGDGAAAGGADEHKTAQEVAMEFTEEEREDVRRMKGSPQLYKQMVESIAPATFGHQEVKRGILLMLLGGVHKTTSEGIKLRGDINVCIVGDPSTAKSQFLKYVHDFLPSRAVYTSGKASSAAGLTAAVQRDQDTGEYCIEAGALMLADNGICCIDEFDKMDPTDQVAIHEAMEQQTISITKAGIQATLNARASILAAANPIYGRYDRTKTLKANVALSAPILSRFDLFFVVLDDCDELADYNVAKHILDVHRCEDEAVRPPFTRDQMRRYIRFARTLNPQISQESQRVLVDCYRKLRQGDTMGRSRTAYRITVRQLESMIRLSEALARLHCDDVIQPQYVREAFRLLRKSIIHVETEDVNLDEDDDDEDMMDAAVEEEEAAAADAGGSNGGEEEGGNVAAAQDAAAAPARHVGEYAGDEEGDDAAATSAPPRDGGNDGTVEEPAAAPSRDATDQPPPKKKAKKSKKKKTQITFEQYEAISNAIATYLRSREGDSEEGEASEDSPSYLTWGEAVEWYLEQCEQQIGDSLEELERMRKLTNLVVRRLINVDHVLIYIGADGSSGDVPEEQRKIAVHPNYVI